MPELYGDDFEASVLDVTKLAGQAVRFRVKMEDADLYALRFAN